MVLFVYVSKKFRQRMKSGQLIQSFLFDFPLIEEAR
jgi:hypothetical protein